MSGVRALAIAAFLLLPACAPAGAASATGREVASFYNVVFFVAVVVFVGVNGALLYFVMAYRRKPTDVAMPPQVHGSTVAEVTWTVIPALIIFGLFGMSWQTMKSVDKKADKPGVVINVQGYQWNWQFNYGGNFVVKAPPPVAGQVPPVLRMKVPLNEPVRFILTSDNVIHSFYVPKLLFKRDVVPGRQNQFDVTIDVPAVYKGQCAEFCGRNHALMNFEIEALNRKDFDTWVKEAKSQSCSGEPSNELALSSPAGQIAFNKDCLVAAAGKPVKITYSNEGGQPHNVNFSKSAADLKPFGTTGTPIKAGSASGEIPPQTPGQYYFYCIVHPVMNGTYKVQ